MRRIEEFTVEFEERPSEFVYGVFDILDSAKGAVIAVFLIFTFVIRPVGVNGDSMNPTLHNGDWVAVSSAKEKFSRGDIVVVNQPWERNVPIIKRVIAVGGDVVNIDFKTGKVFVNGIEQNEPYIAEKTKLKYDVIFPVAVDDGKVFVMGDNRNDSLDSRSGKIGMIDERYILGKALFRAYPFFSFNIYEGGK